jgi:uncharacterized membrane protein
MGYLADLLDKIRKRPILSNIELWLENSPIWVVIIGLLLDATAVILFFKNLWDTTNTIAKAANIIVIPVLAVIMVIFIAVIAFLLIVFVWIILTKIRLTREKLDEIKDILCSWMDYHKKYSKWEYDSVCLEHKILKNGTNICNGDYLVDPEKSNIFFDTIDVGSNTKRYKYHKLKEIGFAAKDTRSSTNTMNPMICFEHREEDNVLTAAVFFKPYIKKGSTPVLYKTHYTWKGLWDDLITNDTGTGRFNATQPSCNVTLKFIAPKEYIFESLVNYLNIGMSSETEENGLSTLTWNIGPCKSGDRIDYTIKWKRR